MSDHFPAILSLQATLKPDKDFLFMATSMVALAKTLGRGVSFTVPDLPKGDEIHVYPSSGVETVAQSLASHFQLTMSPMKLDVPLWIPVDMELPTADLERGGLASVEVLCRSDRLYTPFVGYFHYPCETFPEGAWFASHIDIDNPQRVTHWLRLPPGYLEDLS